MCSQRLSDALTRRELMQAVAAAGLTLGTAARRADNQGGDAGDAGLPARREPELTRGSGLMNDIRGYLAAEARRVTGRACASLPVSARDWLSLLPGRRRQFLEMMGVPELPPPDARSPLNVHVAGVLHKPGYRIEKLHYQSLPGLYVTANLYVPDGLKSPAPAVLYVCGHATNQKAHYQAHPRRFAQLGFVSLIVETIELGEIPGHHHGCYRQGWWHWYSRGYTPAGVEMYNGIRGLDLLASLPYVDANRMGVTGISGGGATSWWVGAADERAKVVAPVCGTGTIASHVAERTVDGHCDCMFFINLYGWDLADVGALIAPRPLLVASADRDGLYSIASIQETVERIRAVYRLLKADHHLRFIATPGGHSYHRSSRTGIFSWFLKHLAGQEAPADKLEDVDERPESQESAESLRVFTAGIPKDERVTTIQDSFVPLAKPPQIADAAALAAHRAKVVADLRARTFHHFPPRSAPLTPRVEMEWQEGWHSSRIAFTPEEGWRLHAELALPSDPELRPAPVLVCLKSPGGSRYQMEEFVGGFDRRWARLFVQVRGVEETSWGPEMSWHIRRAAAITGRTVASMRVLDALRAIELARGLAGVDGKRVAVAAEGEMAAVALYAALLDANTCAVAIGNPPATQNEPSRPDGTGPAVEMLGCLRFTDLPQVAGMLWPAELVFVGQRPDTYAWAEELYARLGAPGATRRVASLAEWRPGV